MCTSRVKPIAVAWSAPGIPDLVVGRERAEQFPPPCDGPLSSTRVLSSAPECRWSGVTYRIAL